MLWFVPWAHDARADRQTVCTITVNSADERDIFRRYLPPDEFRFVELVERGRPDWLASACRAGVRCDVLLISGHFDAGTEFYSDRLDVREYLPVDELERVACSESCPGVFSQLKEVYLFGCNTLNAEAMRSASAEIARSFVRAGYPAADAERLSRVLEERHGESNRDRMRRVFQHVPVIYGFSSKAPLGRAAGPLLERYFRAGPSAEIGSGRVSTRLWGLFAPSSMTVTAGMGHSDPGAGFRRDVCHFHDDRLAPAQKLHFVHELLGREMAEVRMFLDHIERHLFRLDEAERRTPSVSAVLAAIAHDEPARRRYLEFARDADEPAVRVRMLALARRLGWLSPEAERSEIVRMFAAQLAQGRAGSTEIALACSLNKDRELERGLDAAQLPSAGGGTVARAAVLACLGSAEGHDRVLRALTSQDDEHVQLAQTYLQHRPIVDAIELRRVAMGVAQMSESDAQVHALDALARHRLSDRESLEELARAYTLAKSASVQRAIAGVLIHADYRAIASPDLAHRLRQHRLAAADRDDVIDVLIRRMQAP